MNISYCIVISLTKKVTNFKPGNSTVPSWYFKQMANKKTCKAEPVCSVPRRDYFWKIPTDSTEVRKAMPGREALVIFHIIVPARSHYYQLHSSQVQTEWDRLTSSEPDVFFCVLDNCHDTIILLEWDALLPLVKGLS